MRWLFRRQLESLQCARSGRLNFSERVFRVRRCPNRKRECSTCDLETGTPRLAKNSNFYPVILAGGRGTRFWPLSRKKRAKQLLALDGKQTMIQQTVARLLPLAPARKFWIITNEDLQLAIAKQLPKLSKEQVLPEPVGRNTAPAIGLAAFLLLRENPEAVIGMFPSDHVIADEKSYRATIERGAEIAAAGENIVVLGIQPNRGETGYDNIEE